MIYGIGIDILNLERIMNLKSKMDRFAQKSLTPAEYEEYCQKKGNRKIEYLGGRFSCKEAFSKALGSGIGKVVSLQDIETLTNEQGAPVMTSTQFGGKIFVSISHEKKYVITQVLLEKGK